MIDIEGMEAAILDALKTIGALAHVESYQGNIDEILMENVVPLPAALVIYGGFTDENVVARGGAKGEIDVGFGVIVVGQNLSGSGDASLDVRRMLTAARDVLNGLEHQKRTLTLRSEVLSKMSNTGICAYEQEYRYKDWLTT